MSAGGKCDPFIDMEPGSHICADGHRSAGRDDTDACESMMAKVREMYEAGDTIIVCSLSYREYKSGRRKAIYHKVDGEWFLFAPPVKDYRNYSHGFSPQMTAIYYPELWRRLSQE